MKALKLGLARIVRGAIGAVGTLLALFFAWLWWLVFSGPGDDNPIGLLFMIGFGAALVPAWGLFRFFVPARWSRLSWIWLGASALVLTVFVPFALAFL